MSDNIPKQKLAKSLSKAIMKVLSGESEKTNQTSKQAPKKSTKTKGGGSRAGQLVPYHPADATMTHAAGEQGSKPSAPPRKWTTKGEEGVEGAQKQAWATHNPCYLCGRFGHRSAEHDEMPRGPWAPDDKARWELYQKLWRHMRTHIDYSKHRNEVAAKVGVPMGDAQSMDDESFYSLLLRRKANLPEWDTGAMPTHDQGTTSSSSSTPQIAANVTTTPSASFAIGSGEEAEDHSTRKRKKPGLKAKRKQKDTGVGGEGQQLIAFKPPSGPIDMTFGPQDVPPSLKGRTTNNTLTPPHPCVSVPLHTLEDRVTKVEGNITRLQNDSAVTLKLLMLSLTKDPNKQLTMEEVSAEMANARQGLTLEAPPPSGDDDADMTPGKPPSEAEDDKPKDVMKPTSAEEPRRNSLRNTSPPPQDLDKDTPVADYRIADMVMFMETKGARFNRTISRRNEALYLLSHIAEEGLYAVIQEENDDPSSAEDMIWVVKPVRARGLVDNGKAQLELSYEIEAKPRPIDELQEAVPTVLPAEGTWTIDPTRLFIQIETAYETLYSLDPARKRQKLQGQ